MHDAIPERCELGNPAFTALGPPLFRRAEPDGAPAMVVPLGERRAVLPLHTIKHEFAIADASPDGRMLDLIADALDYVAGLRLGDLLPPEVLTGEASWSPAPRHHAIAEARLRRRLPVAGPAVQPAMLVPLTAELAFIEALRETLLAPMRALRRTVQSLGVDWRGNAERRTTLTQVRRLTATACDHLADRFAEIDAQCADPVAALAAIDATRAFVRAHRDWLFRTRRAFAPVLQEWEAAAPLLDEAAWARLGRTYQVLAPRFMPVQEWERATAPRSPGPAPAFGAVMQW